MKFNGDAQVNALLGFYPFAPPSPMPNFLRDWQFHCCHSSSILRKAICVIFSLAHVLVKLTFWACSDLCPYLWRSRGPTTNKRPGHFSGAGEGKYFRDERTHFHILASTLFRPGEFCPKISRAEVTFFRGILRHFETRSENSSSNFFECWSTLEKMSQLPFFSRRDQIFFAFDHFFGILMKRHADGRKGNHLRFKSLSQNCLNHKIKKLSVVMLSKVWDIFDNERTFSIVSKPTSDECHSKAVFQASNSAFIYLRIETCGPRFSRSGHNFFRSHIFFRACEKSRDRNWKTRQDRFFGRFSSVVQSFDNGRTHFERFPNLERRDFTLALSHRSFSTF